MDEMKITSKLMRGVATKLINKAIKSKTGYDINIKLNDLNATVIDGEAHVHIDIDANLPKDVLTELLAKAGL